MDKIIIGTRASKLALTQTNIIVKQLEKIYPDLTIDVKSITTSGDRIKDKALYKVGGKGLFIKEIEAALMEEEIDIAIHSLKDMPGEMDDRFSFACYPERENPADILISRNDKSLNQLPAGASLGTGSFRRRTQLKRYRSDLEFVNLRGNVDTRIKKMEEMDLDGIILAAAGLHRLQKKDLITQYLPLDVSIPAVGQGTLGVEILKKRKDLIKLFEPLDHFYTKLKSIGERKFLKILGGSCNLPLGANVQIKENEQKVECEINGFLASENGNKYIKKQTNIDFKLEQKDELIFGKVKSMGKNLAQKILNDGGQEIISQLEEGS